MLSNPTPAGDPTAHASPQRQPRRPEGPGAHRDTGSGEGATSPHLKNGAATSAHQQKIAATARTCPGCGAEIPKWEAFCAICERARDGGASTIRTTLLHWLMFTVIMGVVIGTGFMLAP